MNGGSMNSPTLNTNNPLSMGVVGNMGAIYHDGGWLMQNDTWIPDSNKDKNPQQHFFGDAGGGAGGAGAGVGADGATSKSGRNSSKEKSSKKGGEAGETSSKEKRSSKDGGVKEKKSKKNKVGSNHDDDHQSLVWKKKDVKKYDKQTLLDICAKMRVEDKLERPAELNVLLETRAAQLKGK